jgi:hypothetical protein
VEKPVENFLIFSPVRGESDPHYKVGVPIFPSLYGCRQDSSVGFLLTGAMCQESYNNLSVAMMA